MSLGRQEKPGMELLCSILLDGELRPKWRGLEDYYILFSSLVSPSDHFVVIASSRYNS